MILLSPVFGAYLLVSWLQCKREIPKSSPSLAMKIVQIQREIPIDAYSCRCGFKLPWKVVLGGRQPEQEAREHRSGLYRLPTNWP
jgi:hypothetical protein